MSTLPYYSNYQAEFDSFLEQERRGLVPERPVLFYGSSSIRLWEGLATDFKGLPILNRGFGGSTLQECLEVMDRWVLPLRPRATVLYAGDNDLDHGASPEQVRDRFEQFVSRVRDRLGWVPTLLLSIKPSPSRFWNIAKIDQTNFLFEQAIRMRWHEATYVNVSPTMLAADGSPRHELYTDDGLHMSRAGYAIWREGVKKALAELGLEGESPIL